MLADAPDLLDETFLRADHARMNVARVRAGRLGAAEQDDCVAEEVPIALEYNGISHATMLATPADLEDFALGFSLTEGIVDSASDVRGMDLRQDCDGIVVALEISSACAMRLRERRRAMAGRTGCGLCGVETLPEVLRPVSAVSDGPAVSVGAVLQAMRDMRARQALHDLTGATHAAGWADGAGRVALVREDVGRHNALDKLVGALARAGQNAARGMVLVSSRASFEMVQKTAAAGAGILAAVSAPTALAVRIARQNNLTLLGFLRDADATIYTHPERMLP
jgi:FdhD protein